MVLVKNWQFSHLFILGKKIPWKDISRYSRKKNAFQGFKNMNLNKRENVFKDILERKNAFLAYKNKKFKKVEKLTFFQRG